MAHTHGPAVSFRNVTKSYDEVTAVDDISFDIPRGTICGIVGTSGAGKSTLLRTVNGLEKPTSGTIETLGEEPARLSTSALRTLRRKVGMVFQHYNLVGSKTVAENVAMPLLLAGVAQEERERRVAEALSLVGLAERASHRPTQLSGGQQQRVGIARALVTNPEILLCDEPTSALDPITTAQILELLARINRELGLTIIVITHQMSVVARIADDVAVLENGSLIEHGPVEKVFAQPVQPLTRRFVETVIPQRLPDDVRTRARSKPTDVLVRVVHTGGAAASLIGDLSSTYPVKVSLLHAADAPLRRTTVGTLVLAISGASSDVDAALADAHSRPNVNVEVLP
ncbi:methionine ABC transporter ATP-binding protein [Corynebacterium renale]|uniref:D-methionine transport system ATP-binding protein n=1 Tax=Corynebacterium renale TaxID=1724 RepID=A0A2A9DNR4_9CORY|nr:ATP-binding cassette domain-containing protein [Corynebacterium renale]PFG27612.1 D-methionine transport system ATP-binding protein [Corynebacterium renale]SQI22811.1 ABC transporter [Corynebacterium renale]